MTSDDLARKYAKQILVECRERNRTEILPGEVLRLIAHAELLAEVVLQTGEVE